MLKDKAKKLNGQGGIPFMDGREKAELPTQSSVTIIDYGFINGDDGEYVVLDLAEFPKQFFFGGSVITDMIKELDADLTDEERKEIHEVGLPALFTKKKNKAGKREYTTCEFYPEF